MKHERTAECVVAGYRVHKDGNGVGSLLLGLFDDTGRLNHVGVAASFPVTKRAELLAEMQPLTVDAVADHPWRDWAEAQAHAEGRMPGAVSRWNAQKDLSWVPVRCERVLEVTFGQLRGGALPPWREVRPLAARPRAVELHATTSSTSLPLWPSTT